MVTKFQSEYYYLSNYRAVLNNSHYLSRDPILVMLKESSHPHFLDCDHDR